MPESIYDNGSMASIALITFLVALVIMLVVGAIIKRKDVVYALLIGGLAMGVSFVVMLPSTVDTEASIIGSEKNLLHQVHAPSS